MTDDVERFAAPPSDAWRVDIDNRRLAVSGPLGSSLELQLPDGAPALWLDQLVMEAECIAVTAYGLGLDDADWEARLADAIADERLMGIRLRVARG